MSPGFNVALHNRMARNFLCGAADTPATTCTQVGYDKLRRALIFLKKEEKNGCSGVLATGEFWRNQRRNQIEKRFLLLF
jgi:hypothetical protein